MRPLLQHALEVARSAAEITRPVLGLRESEPGVGVVGIPSEQNSERSLRVVVPPLPEENPRKGDLCVASIRETAHGISGDALCVVESPLRRERVDLVDELRERQLGREEGAEQESESHTRV